MYVKFQFRLMLHAVYSMFSLSWLVIFCFSNWRFLSFALEKTEALFHFLCNAASLLLAVILCAETQDPHSPVS